MKHCLYLLTLTTGIYILSAATTRRLERTLRPNPTWGNRLADTPPRGAKCTLYITKLSSVWDAHNYPVGLYCVLLCTPPCTVYWVQLCTPPCTVYFYVLLHLLCTEYNYLLNHVLYTEYNYVLHHVLCIEYNYVLHHVLVLTTQYTLSGRTSSALGWHSDGRTFAAH